MGVKGGHLLPFNPLSILPVLEITEPFLGLFLMVGTGWIDLWVVMGIMEFSIMSETVRYRHEPNGEGKKRETGWGCR